MSPRPVDDARICLCLLTLHAEPAYNLFKASNSCLPQYQGVSAESAKRAPCNGAFCLGDRSSMGVHCQQVRGRQAETKISQLSFT